MRKFILIMFIGLSLFAIDTLSVTQVTGDGVRTHRLWSDTLTWTRGAGDSLLILNDISASFDITNWDDISVLGTYGWDTTKLYYQLGNKEADFDTMTVWSIVDSVSDSTLTYPHIQSDLTTRIPSKLIRFLATAGDTVVAGRQKLEFQFLGIEDK